MMETDEKAAQVPDQAEYISYEFEATNRWKAREYDAAKAAASQGLVSALNAGFIEGAARLLVLRMQCEVDSGDFRNALESAEELERVAGTADPLLLLKGKKLIAVALHGLGHLDEAVVYARKTIAEAPRTAQGRRASMDLYWTLLAVLSEGGVFEEAWESALALAELAAGTRDGEAAGKSYWAIGNVAFMTGRNEEAVHYHQLAAQHLSARRDVSIWALFNKASAHMRLMADLVTEDTLDCLERAELAISVTGGTPRDKFELGLLRAQWELLGGSMEAAVKKLRSLLEEEAEMPPVVMAEYWYLCAVAAEKAADYAAVREYAKRAYEIFRETGMGARLHKAQELLDRVEDTLS